MPPASLGLTTTETAVLPPLQSSAKSPSIHRSWWYRWRSILTGLCVLLGLGTTIFSVPLVPESTMLAWHLNHAGWLLLLAGIGVRLWATLYIGGRKSREVVCAGPYSLCRNPLYWGTFFALLSQIAFYKSLPLAIGLIFPFWLYCTKVVPAEEALLLEKMGESYAEYRRRVPRWWPRWSNFQTAEQIPVDIISLRNELSRVAIWIWLPFVADTLNLLRQSPQWVVLFHW